MRHADRLHSLNNLRALMMWLGIVLHLALNHMKAPTTVPWKDYDTSVIADLIFYSSMYFACRSFSSWQVTLSPYC